MKINYFLLNICIVFLFQTSYAGNDTLFVTLYETSEDFLLKKPMNADAMLITKSKGKGHFFVKKIINRSTGKKINDINFIWAITHKNDTYLNMGYLESGNAPGTFVIVDVVGKYCLIKYDERIPFPHFYDLRTLSSAAGLTGALLYDLNQTLDKPYLWKDSEGNKFPILFCNTEEKERRNFAYSQNESCRLYYFKHNDLRKFRAINLEISLHSDSTVEEILEYFHSKNIIYNESGQKLK